MSNKILMAVGDSGGHIYPALAIASRLQKLDSSLDIHFVHSGKVVHQKLWDSFSYPVHQISIGGLAQGQNFLMKIKTLFQLPFAFIQAYFLLKKHKFYCVFGTGGAVTGPVLLMARWQGCSVSFWEGNSTSGLANKYLSRFVSPAFTVFKNVLGFSPQTKIISCGYPLRERIEQEAQASSLEQSDSQTLSVLILGGSQGSSLLNQVVSQALEQTAWRKDIFIYHQTGKKDFLKIQESYKDKQGVKVFDFNSHIQEYYKKCQVVFSRAGSGVLAELAAFKKSAVLIPLSRSAGGHQFKNALSLQEQSSVALIKEEDFNVEKFKEMVLSLKNEPQKRKNLALSLSQHHKKEGAQTIAQWIIDQRKK